MRDSKRTRASTVARAGSVIHVLVSRQRARLVTWRKPERAGERLDPRAHAARDRLDVRRVVVDGLAVELPPVDDGELQPAERAAC